MCWILPVFFFISFSSIVSCWWSNKMHFLRERKARRWRKRIRNSVFGLFSLLPNLFSLECSSITRFLRDKFSIARDDRILRIYEALAIKLFKPDLCKQKDHVLDLLASLIHVQLTEDSIASYIVRVHHWEDRAKDLWWFTLCL